MMVGTGRGRAGWAVAAAFIGFAGVPAVAHATPAVGAAPLTGRLGVVNAVDVVARGNVWTGGYHNPLTRPMLYHKLQTWHAEPMPGYAPELYAIDATSSADVWAAGDAIYHWDGARWRTVPAPNPGDEATYYGIAALSPANAWAVGGFLDENTETERTLVAHWNGHSWQRIPSPTRGWVDLHTVSFASANDGWAAGGRLVLHWDGTRWTRLSLPRAMGSTQSLVALSKRDVWAVGASIWHWDGTRWSEAAYPLRRTSTLNAVDAYAANGVWAVGRTCTRHDGCHTLALRWNGTRWTRTPTPNPAPGVVMTGVSAFGPRDVWAVGYHGGTDHERVVALRWTGSHWSVG